MATARRQGLVGAVALTGTGLLGASLSTEPDSTQFYALTFAAAGTWLVGGLVAEPVHLRSPRTDERSAGRHVVIPILTGAAAFGVFFGAAHVARRVPILNEALESVLSYANRGSDPWVLATTLANAVGEELFFRGALFSALGVHNPVPVSTVVYMLATTATRNPALVLASGVMGSLFALQRRASGGVQSPILTHVTWSALMLRYIPALFRDPMIRHDETSRTLRQGGAPITKRTGRRRDGLRPQPPPSRWKAGLFQISFGACTRA
jgi:uncharacterized protein